MSERFLAIQVKMVGDLLLCLPALEELRSQRPQALIEVVTLPSTAALASCAAVVDRVHVWRKRGLNAGVWTDFLGAKRADWCLDFSGTDRALGLSLLGRKRLGYRKYARDSGLRRRLYTKVSTAILKRQHAAQYYLGLLEGLEMAPGEGGEPRRARLGATVKARERAQEVLKQCGVEGDFVALQPGSARAEKYWPARSWARLICELRERGVRTVILGGNERVERDHLERIDFLCACQGAVNLAGKLSFVESLAVLERAQALVGVDSALMHLAAALGLPQLALFGPTDPFHWGPWNEQALTLHAAMPATPMRTRQWSWQQLPEPTRMAELSVEAVLAAWEGLELRGD